MIIMFHKSVKYLENLSVTVVLKKFGKNSPTSGHVDQKIMLSTKTTQKTSQISSTSLISFVNTQLVYYFNSLFTSNSFMLFSPILAIIFKAAVSSNGRRFKMENLKLVKTACKKKQLTSTSLSLLFRNNSQNGLHAWLKWMLLPSLSTAQTSVPYVFFHWSVHPVAWENQISPSIKQFRTS